MLSEMETLRQQQMTKIECRQAAKQLVDFSTLQIDGLYPTDIDGILEYKDRCWVIYEFKYGHAPLKDGQRICLENLARRLEMGGTPAIVIIGDHDQHKPEEDIDSGYAITRAVYWERRWQAPKNETTVAEMTHRFIDWVLDRGGHDGQNDAPGAGAERYSAERR